MLARVVLITTLFVMMQDNISIFGFSATAIGWLVPLSFSVWQIAFGKEKIKFPWLLWVPWIALTFGYLVISTASDAFQRTVMLLCPIATGMAVSMVRVGWVELAAFLNVCRYAALVIIALVLLKSGLLLTGQLPSSTGLAADVMTAALLSSVFASTYVGGYRMSLYWWISLAFVPFVAMTRTVMVVSALTLPSTLAPLGIVKRVIILLIMSSIGLAVFHTQRVQDKMFFSGQGTLSDISFDNPDFKTTGRVTILHVLEEEVSREPWFGHGANASESLVEKIAGGLTHPHNDWLRFEYDYGYFGTSVFAFCLLLQTVHAWWQARRSSGVARVLLYAGASSFISMALIMTTDNIVLYAAFFGNLQFAILGLAYAALKVGQARVKVEVLA